VPDPRVKASQQDLVEQRDLALEISRGMKSTYNTYEQVATLRKALADRQKGMSGDNASKLKEPAAALEKKIDAVEKGTKAAPGLGPVNRDLARLIFSVESADMKPAETVTAAVRQSCEALDKALVLWRQINQQEIAPVSAMLVAGGAAALPVVPVDAGGCKQ
jgi:hypothetical protein